jgi:hypothetical protein
MRTKTRAQRAPVRSGRDFGLIGGWRNGCRTAARDILLHHTIGTGTRRMFRVAWCSKSNRPAHNCGSRRHRSAWNRARSKGSGTAASRRQILAAHVLRVSGRLVGFVRYPTLCGRAAGKMPAIACRLGERSLRIPSRRRNYRNAVRERPDVEGAGQKGRFDRAAIRAQGRAGAPPGIGDRPGPMHANPGVEPGSHPLSLAPRLHVRACGRRPGQED